MIEVIAAVGALPDFQWSGDVDEETPLTARFLASVLIAGVPHHLCGIQVRENEAGEQVAAYLSCEQELCDLFVLASPDEPFATVEVEGRAYVVYLHPFGR